VASRVRILQQLDEIRGVDALRRSSRKCALRLSREEKRDRLLQERFCGSLRSYSLLMRIASRSTRVIFPSRDFNPEKQTRVATRRSRI